jgi:hypothetical protein
MTTAHAGYPGEVSADVGGLGTLGRDNCVGSDLNQGNRSGIISG